MDLLKNQEKYNHLMSLNGIKIDDITLMSMPYELISPLMAQIRDHDIFHFLSTDKDPSKTPLFLS